MSRLKPKGKGNVAMPQQRRLVGPGTTVMVLALICVGGVQLLSKPKVTIERHVEPSADAGFLRKPSIWNVLSWSAELDLTAEQRNSLEKLALEEKRRLAPVETRIAEKLKQFNEFSQKHNSEAVALETLQMRAGPISLLSREKRQIQQDFANQALTVLEPNQKDKLKRLWQASIKQKAGKEAASP